MTRGKAWRYPDRKRCATCRGYLGFVVVEGLYDSYACAGRTDPAGVPPEEWPREHFVPLRDGTRRAKRVHPGEVAARRAANLRGKEAYVCGFCGEWHIGSPRRPD